MTELLEAPTVEQVLLVLDFVVAERGEDYVYPDEWRDGGTRLGTCLYVTPDGTGPACIVGAVVARLGVSLARLSRSEGQSARSVMEQVFGLPDRSPQSAVLQGAQVVQDGGGTWGDARDKARERADQIARKG